ncbi:hypothetical protein GCM10009528_23170 [Kineococcus aurantiacus]|nr:HNH endonuclease signature motif containing protein [Kineococcus aurantiacus]
MGRLFCSDRCEVSAALHEEAEVTGYRRAYCSACQRVKAAEDFHHEQANRNGLSGRCKDCTRLKYEGTKEAYQRRRYRYQAGPGGRVLPFTAQQQEERFSLWEGRCWKCGIAEATEADHVKPISKGGWHCLANLRPICHSCNARKRETWPLAGEWLAANFIHPNPAPGSDRLNRRPREPRMEHTCPQCGKTQLLRACEARIKKYCSRACMKTAKQGGRLTLICEHCREEFEVRDQTWARERRFCSRSCAYQGNRRRQA